MIKDNEARVAFNSLVSITIGNGNKTLFWHDRWMHGRCAEDLAPTLLKSIKTRTVNARTVAQGLRNNSWAVDLTRPFTEEKTLEFERLQTTTKGIQLIDDTEDKFSWPWSRSGEYTAKSTYDMLMQGDTRFSLSDAIWKSCATQRATCLYSWLHNTRFGPQIDIRGTDCKRPHQLVMSVCKRKTQPNISCSNAWLRERCGISVVKT
jgi:hypothetical protein